MEGRRFRVSQTTLLGRSQNMLRTVTSVERYHRYKIHMDTRKILCHESAR
ncbi:MAG: hypothetical protein HFG92_17100 [Dorea sp.]|nr:hypothetical protein [Dorea sp.]